MAPYTQATILNSDPDRIGALKNKVQFMFWNSKDYKGKLGNQIRLGKYKTKPSPNSRI